MVTCTDFYPECDDYNYGDTGRYELWLNAILRSIKYCLKILKMSGRRYVRKVYDMMRHDDSLDNWAGKLKKYCIAIILHILWESQHVVNTNICLRHLRERMITVSNTKWLNILYRSDRYNIYRLLKEPDIKSHT